MWTIRGLFMDTYSRCTVRVLDATVFHKFEAFTMGKLIHCSPTKNTVVNGVPLPSVILGDPTYPLQPWLYEALF